MFNFRILGKCNTEFNHMRDFERTSVRTSAVVPFCADLGPRDSVPSYSARIPKSGI